jgi:hypothetical protein
MILALGSREVMDAGRRKDCLTMPERNVIGGGAYALHKA